MGLDSISVAIRSLSSLQVEITNTLLHFNYSTLLGALEYHNTSGPDTFQIQLLFRDCNIKSILPSKTEVSAEDTVKLMPFGRLSRR